MSESNSTPANVPSKTDKPAKPYAEFPLYAHAAGAWPWVGFSAIHRYTRMRTALVDKS